MLNCPDGAAVRGMAGYDDGLGSSATAVSRIHLNMTNTKRLSLSSRAPITVLKNQFVKFESWFYSVGWDQRRSLQRQEPFRIHPETIRKIPNPLLNRSGCLFWLLALTARILALSQILALRDSRPNSKFHPDKTVPGRTHRSGTLRKHQGIDAVGTDPAETRSGSHFLAFSVRCG